MKEVLSVFTFGIGALCFVVFVTVFKPTAVSAVDGTSKPEYLTSRPLAADRTSFAPETTAPNTTNAIEPERKRSKINEADRYPAAHNGLVAGSSPAGPTTLRPAGYAWRSHAGPEGRSVVSGVAERSESEDGLVQKPIGRRRAVLHASYGSARYPGPN